MNTRLISPSDLPFEVAISLCTRGPLDPFTAVTIRVLECSGPRLDVKLWYIRTHYFDRATRYTTKKSKLFIKNGEHISSEMVSSPERMVCGNKSALDAPLKKDISILEERMSQIYYELASTTDEDSDEDTWEMDDEDEYPEDDFEVIDM